MNSETTNQFLSEVSQILKRFEEELDLDGSRFNIFSILNLTSNEVRLHTRFIGELLNTKGTHTYDKSFLDSFVKILKANITSNNTLNLFNVEKAKVEIEKYTHKIDKNYNSGGQIDIILTDQNDKQVIIENKIFAKDQENQLLRYHNYNKNALLLYLTLDGSKPSVMSTNNQLNEGEHYHCVSYKELIVEWLTDCIKISESKPKVSETLSQYLNVVHDYTNQSKRNIMTSKITELITKEKEYFLAIPEIINSYNSIKRTVIKKIWESISEKQPLSGKVLSIEPSTNINYQIFEPKVYGFSYEFSIEINGVQQQNSQEIEFLFNKCHHLNPKLQKGPFSFWANPKKFNFLDQYLSNEMIFELNNRDEELNKFTDEIVLEFHTYIDEIKKSYENDLKYKSS